MTRKVELWVQILELNENGEYCPVEVTPAKDVSTGGIFQLRQVRWHGQGSSCAKKTTWEASLWMAEVSKEVSSSGAKVMLRKRDGKWETEQNSA